MANKEFSITMYIPLGRKNAIPMRELALLLNVYPRALRAIIQRERANGAAICSDFRGGGYYLPANVDEALDYLNQQKARVKSAAAALNGVRAFIEGAESYE